MAVTSRRVRTYASADCVTCGREGPISTSDVEAARRWARRHATENPGHDAHLITESTRVYATDGAS